MGELIKCLKALSPAERWEYAERLRAIIHKVDRLPANTLEQASEALEFYDDQIALLHAWARSRAAHRRRAAKGG